jgi:hypothetical protein
MASLSAPIDPMLGALVNEPRSGDHGSQPFGSPVSASSQPFVHQ